MPISIILNDHAVNFYLGLRDLIISATSGVPNLVLYIGEQYGGIVNVVMQ
jgi:hypothetical protein